MKTPPFLLFATLLFWGWQSDFFWAGALAGAALEAARFFNWRWDLEDVDFNRIWSFCVLVMFVLAAYIFTTNDEGGGFAGKISGPAAAHNVTISSTIATTSVLRWLPLICFPFIAAQVYNARPSVPLTAVSLVLRWRRRRGENSLAGRYTDLSYAYFILCVFAAGIHHYQATHTYFTGSAVLILWALWALRSRHYGLKHWALAFALVIALGFLGQVGVGEIGFLAQNFEARLLARLFRPRTDASQSVTALGDVGELLLSPRIVVRLEPKTLGLAPDYLREASYRVYGSRNQTWFIPALVRDFASVPPQPDNSTWILLSNKVGTATVNISCYLNGRSSETHDPQGVLPLPSGTCRLENLPNLKTAYSLETNRTGTVLATGSGLMTFDARYGPGATFDSPPDTGTNQFDLLVPTNEIPALQQVIAELQLAATNDAEKRLAVETFFTHKFTYSTWQGRDKLATPTATPLTRFLLTSRSGHCEYFATATVLLLRQLGIPARYAVGYAVHETSGSGYVVRERDAHAWCLAWNREKKIWEDFDTTPASWISIEGRRASAADWLSDGRSWLVFQMEKLIYRQSNLRQYILWTLTPVMAVLVYYIIFQRRTKTRPAKKSAPDEPAMVWPGHDSAFYRLEKALAACDLPRAPGESLSDWLERVLAEPSLTGLRGRLRELLQLHYRYRFDPHGLNDAEKKSLVENVERVLEMLAQEEKVR